MWKYVLCHIIFNIRQAESVFFYNHLHTVTLAHMWLLNNLSSFVKNVIIVKHNTSAFGKTCPSVVLYCFLKYLRECQFFKEIVIFQKFDPFFVLFQTAITLLILTLHWKATLFLKCLYPYFNFKWSFDVATEVKILLWHTYKWDLLLALGWFRHCHMINHVSQWSHFLEYWWIYVIMHKL